MNAPAKTASVLMVLALCAPAWCAVIWDPGQAILGGPEDKQIEIAISTETPSIDAWHIWDVCDSDHYVQPDQSEPGDDGTNLDAWAGWNEGGCWWGCTGGSVTQGYFATTWTAPTCGGAYTIGCLVQDLPKALWAGETGTRDDTGLYVDTPESQMALAVEVSVAVNDVSGTNEGPKRFSIFADPGDILRGTTTPDTQVVNQADAGFWKRAECVGTVTPGSVTSGDFDWYQQMWGEWKYDGAYAGNTWGQMSPFTYWTDDGQEPVGDNLCTRAPSDGKLFFVDWPGTATGGWNAGPGEHTYTWTGIGGNGAFRFRTRVKFKGRWCAPYWTEWSREVRLHSSAATGYNWVADANN